MRYILFGIPVPYLAVPIWVHLVIALAGVFVGTSLCCLLARFRGGRRDVGQLLAPFALGGAVGGLVLGQLAGRFVFGVPLASFTVPIMGYGLMIVLGFVCGIGLAYWRAARCGENPEHIMNMGLLALIGGIGGARLVYVLGNVEQFTGQGLFGNLKRMVNVRGGGLVYYGGLVLAVALVLIYVVRKRLSARRILDILTPSLMVGLAFGRVGCTLNGCCWGGRCTLDSPAAQRLLTVRFPFASPAFEQQAQRLHWKVVNKDGQVFGYYVATAFPIPGGGRTYLHFRSEEKTPPPGPHLVVPVAFLEQEKVRLADEPSPAFGHRSRDEITTAADRRLGTAFRSLPIYPVQPYGIVNALLVCLVTTAFFRRRRREGQVFALMLILYAISRFLLEGIRQDTDPVALGMTLSQNISLYVFLGGVGMWWIVSRLPAVARVPLSGVSTGPPDASSAHVNGK